MSHADRPLDRLIDPSPTAEPDRGCFGDAFYSDPFAGWTQEQIDAFYASATQEEIDAMVNPPVELTDALRSGLEALLADAIEHRAEIKQLVLEGSQ